MAADGAPSHDGAVAALARALTAVPLRGIDATLCRAVRAKYLDRDPPEPLFFLGSSRAGARYTPLGGPAALYLATDQTTAFAEIQDLFFDSHGWPRPLRAADPVTLVCVRVAMGGVLDLTDADTLRRLALTTDGLRGEWRPAMEAWVASGGPMPLTQRLGLAAHLTGRVRGIWFRSARAGRGHCLAVFRTGSPPPRATGWRCTTPPACSRSGSPDRGVAGRHAP